MLNLTTLGKGEGAEKAVRLPTGNDGRDLIVEWFYNGFEGVHIDGYNYLFLKERSRGFLTY